MKIAILGWGSLIWNLKGLPVTGDWVRGGPVLPIEFSRVSSDGRLTLVIDEINGAKVTTRYALSARTNVKDTVEDLRVREGTTSGWIGFLDLTQAKQSSEMTVMNQIKAWAKNQGIDAVVWTALPPNFEEKTGNLFSAESAIAYLKVLSERECQNALHYITKAPEEVDTPLRRAVASNLSNESSMETDQQNTFVRVNDAILIDVISNARERLVFIAPGVRMRVAKALAKAIELLPSRSLHLVLDVDAEICRLGYGSMEGLALLQQVAARHGRTLKHHPGIRIGLVIADDTTVIYSPTPLLIEAGLFQPDKPNAIILRGEVPFTVTDACGLDPAGVAEVQVGKNPVDAVAVEAVAKNLRDRPAKKFNVARIERVFSSLLHYVEFKIEDYKLTSRALVLDSELLASGMRK
jgi:hypothetical protein